MAFPTRIGTHPIHPMLVPFPIALWIFSFVCDVIYATGWGGPLWSEMAFYSILGGVVGGLAAAVFGLGDYLSLTEPAAIRIGKTHMILNVAIVSLFLINLFLRLGSPHIPGAGALLLSIIGLVILGVSGWLGGELVYVHGVGVTKNSTRRAEKGKPTAA
jgi:uncharacterized membrane protein